MNSIKSNYKLVAIAFLTLLLSATFHTQNSEQLFRTPSINPNGDQIAFSHQGDIWTVGINGGNAKRITIHDAYELNPTWADDNSIIFESNRFGHSDVFMSSPIGNTPKRLTYYSSGNSYPTCSGEEIFFSSNRIYNQIDWSSEVYVTTKKGGTPQRAMNGMGYHPSPSPNGKFIAYERGPCRTERVAYKGSANREIWIFDRQQKTHTQITHFDGQDILPVLSGNETLYFLSARKGVYNLYKFHINRGKTIGKPTQITEF